MSIFIGASVGMLGQWAPCNRNDMRMSHAAYSERWWAFGQDLLWTRSRFVQVASSVSSFFWDMNPAMDIWEWDLILSEETKAGRRDAVSGITRDSTGAALGSVTVKGFDVTRDLLVDSTTSDASGNFSVTTPYTGQLIYLYSYKAGTPVYGASGQLTPV